eukprot:923445_1
MDRDKLELTLFNEKTNETNIYCLQKIYDRDLSSRAEEISSDHDPSSNEDSSDTPIPNTAAEQEIKIKIHTKCDEMNLDGRTKRLYFIFNLDNYNNDNNKRKGAHIVNYYCRTIVQSMDISHCPGDIIQSIGLFYIVLEDICEDLWSISMIQNARLFDNSEFYALIVSDDSKDDQNKIIPEIEPYKNIFKEIHVLTLEG